MYKHFYSNRPLWPYYNFLGPRTRVFSRMSDGVGMPTAVSSIKSQLALLSRKGDVCSSLLDAQRRRGRTWTRIVTGERMMTNNQRTHADYRQTRIVTGECKMANGLLLHATIGRLRW